MLSLPIKQFFVSIKTSDTFARPYLYAAENRAADDANNRKGGMSCEII